MNLVSCPRCGSQFDVSSFAAGSTFKCGECDNVLQVPGAAAPPASPPASPPAAPPAALAAKAGGRKKETAGQRARRKAAPDPRRAGAPNQGPAREGRAERLRRQRAEGGAQKKGNGPLILVAVASLIIVVGGLAMVMGGKDEGGSGDGEDSARLEGGSSSSGEGTSSSGGGEAAPDDADWDSLPESRRLAMIQKKLKEASTGVIAARQSYEWFTERGLEDEAQQSLERGRVSDPTDKWINDKLGLVDRSARIKEVMADEFVQFEVPTDNADLVLIQELGRKIKKDEGAAWLTAEKAAEVDAAADRLMDFVRKMQDPVYQRTVMEFNNMKSNPVFTGMDFEFKSYRPYVIFAETPGEGMEEAAARVVDATGESLTNLYAEFRRFLREDLGLDAPDLADEVPEAFKREDDRLRVFVFKSRESFDNWHTRNEQNNPGASTAAYYQHGRDRMIMMHLDSFDPHVIMHEGTHQLIHYYSRFFCQLDDNAIAKKDGAPVEEVLYKDGRLNSQFFWFQEGIAEYFGGLHQVGGENGRFVPGGILHDRVGFWQFMQSQNQLWELEDYFDANQGQLTNRAKVKQGGVGGDTLKGLVSAQGWTLVHYLFNGDNGKWRDKFHEMIRRELKGRSTVYDLFASFGLPESRNAPEVKAWLDEVDKGYRGYFEVLKARALKERNEKR